DSLPIFVRYEGLVLNAVTVREIIGCRSQSLAMENKHNSHTDVHVITAQGDFDGQRGVFRAYPRVESSFLTRRHLELLERSDLVLVFFFCTVVCICFVSIQ